MKDFFRIIILSILLSGVFVANTFADSGLKMGFNLGSFSISDPNLSGWGNTTNYQIGLFSELNLMNKKHFKKSNLRFQPEIWFVKTGSEYNKTFSGDSNLNHIELYYIRSAILFKHYLKTNLPVPFLGIYYAYKLNSISKNEHNGETVKINIKDEFKKSDFGFILGASYNLPFKNNLFFVELSYSKGFTNILNNDFNERQIRNNSLSLNLGYRF